MATDQSNINLSNSQPQPEGNGHVASHDNPAPETFETVIAAAKATLSKNVDEGTKTLLTRADQGRSREICVRDLRNKTFTEALVKERPSRAKGTLLHVCANNEFANERQCKGCAQPGLQVRGPFTTCCASADLFRGACSNCIYADKANDCSLTSLVVKRAGKHKTQYLYKVLKPSDAEEFHASFSMFSPDPQRSDLIAAVPTSKKKEKKHPALDSGEDSPSKRHRENTSPDRAVDLSKKGLETLQELTISIRSRCSVMMDKLEEMDNEIEDALAGRWIRRSDESGSGLGGAN